jgi:hypothetical protein
MHQNFSAFDLNYKHINAALKQACFQSTSKRYLPRKAKQKLMFVWYTNDHQLLQQKPKRVHPPSANQTFEMKNAAEGNIPISVPSTNRLNMELDLQSLFWLHVHICTHCLRPRNLPPVFGPIYEGAIG